MPIVILARHGRTEANAKHILAGRSPGVVLDERGVAQATEAALRLNGVDLAAIVTSPMERCRETAKILGHGSTVKPRTDRRLTECDYGDWTGKPMSSLVSEDLWKVVQQHPTAVRFPDGESLTEMASRAVSAVREHDRALAASNGADCVWLAVSHGDVIKAILADALGMHLDAFQRITVDPASLSVVHYTSARPCVLSLNSVAGSLASLVNPRAESPAGTVGGGAGGAD